MSGGTRPGGWLDDTYLESSSVVANSAMNRQRQLAGVNSYTRELGFNPVDWLDARLGGQPPTCGTVAWLDLCCGTGRALIGAAERAADAGLADRIRLVGVDLVDFFDPLPGHDGYPELVCASLARWAPDQPFDLVTCVHGLHYVGDKLGLLHRAAGWLAPGGRLVADLDLSGIRLPDGSPGGGPLRAALRAAGFTYDARRRRITHAGAPTRPLPYAYLGADDRAGANYTGQPAVDSYYLPAG